MARRIRIITGLILFAFATGHLLNLSLGLHSLSLMDSWRGFFMAPWTNPVGGPLLLASLVSHGLLSLSSLYHRNTLRMSGQDMIQFASGLLVLPLLVPHIVALKLAPDLIAGYLPSYRGLLDLFWVQNPLEGLRQIMVVVVVWVHGSIGLITFFRLQPWWQKLGPVINALMVIVPVGALLGFAEAGKEVISLSAGYVSSPPGPEILRALATIDTVKWTVISIYGLMVIITLVARHARLRGHFRRTRVNFVGGPEISAETGTSVLELAIAHDVPHANLCRGRGRCGTCQVEIVSADHKLPAASELEQATLTRLQAGPDVRLSCQLKPGEGEITVKRLLPPYITPAELKLVYIKQDEDIKVAADTIVEAGS